MILEAFSQVLQREKQETGGSAMDILHGWLLSLLSEAVPQDNVTRVIHTEIALVPGKRGIAFMGKSPTGEVLLKSLYIYCESYEHWQFRRWLHELKPHAFNRLSG